MAPTATMLSSRVSLRSTRVAGKAPVAARAAAKAAPVRAAGTDYGLGLELNTTVQKTVRPGKADVPLELEEVACPNNTFKNKEPYVAKCVSVERIVGPEATGETTHIIIDTKGDMPF